MLKEKTWSKYKVNELRKLDWDTLITDTQYKGSLRPQAGHVPPKTQVPQLAPFPPMN